MNQFMYFSLKSDYAVAVLLGLTTSNKVVEAKLNIAQVTCKCLGDSVVQVLFTPPNYTVENFPFL